MAEQARVLLLATERHTDQAPKTAGTEKQCIAPGTQAPARRGQIHQRVRADARKRFRNAHKARGLRTPTGYSI